MSPSLRVVIMIKACPAHTAGGMQVHCGLLSRGLAARGHEVTVVTTSLPGRREELDGGVRTVFLDGTPPGRDSWAWQRESAGFLSSMRGRVDVVFSESYAAAGYAAVRDEVGVPFVARVTGFWSSYRRDQWREVRTPLQAARWLLVKVPESFAWTRWAERPCVERADRLIALTAGMRAELISRYGVPPERVALIPNGVDAPRSILSAGSRERCRGRLGLDPGAVVIAMSGVLTRQKGFQLGVEAFRRLRAERGDAALLVLGDGPAGPELRRMAEDIPGARFAGEVPNAAVPEALAACDVYLCPTLRREGLPFAALEALGAGLPIVASRGPGLTDAVADGVNGVLVAPGDIRALADAAARLAADPALRRAMGAASRELFERRFTADRMVEGTLEVLREAAGS